MGREASATVRALLRCARQVSSESPGRGLGSWPAAAGGRPPCLTRHGARRGVRSASSGWTSALVQTADQITARFDPNPAPPFALSGSARSFARRMSGRGRRGSDEPSRDAPAHRVNDQITAKQIRLVVDPDPERATTSGETSIDSESNAEGSAASATKSTHEVLSTLVALRRARLAGLDLVEVNARADPPVCRLMRYDSFRYARKQKERDGRRAAVERRRADTVKELKLTARISPNDVRVKADKAQKFLTNGHKVTLRVEFKTNDGVKPSLRKKAGDVLFDEFRRTLTDSFQKPHVVVQEGKMVGPNHMTITLAPEREARKGKTKKGKLASDAEARAEARPSGDEDKDEANAPIPEGADPATFLAEATAQGDVVRALKARRSSGDDAVQQKDVDDAVARLLRLKARAEKFSAAGTNVAAATEPIRRGSASGERSRAFASSARRRGFSTRPMINASLVTVGGFFSVGGVSSETFSPANEIVSGTRPRPYSRSAHGRAVERVGAAKARAKSRAAKEAAKRVVPIERTASDATRAPSVARNAGEAGAEREPSSARAKENDDDDDDDDDDATARSWSDPSSFRLGDAAEERIAYAREEARVAAVLSARREARARAQARVDRKDAPEGDFFCKEPIGGEDGSRGSGAWAGAAAAATLAAAVAATLAATAASELTLVPRRGTSERNDDAGEEARLDRLRTRETEKPATSFSATRAAAAFAGGAGVVVSALGWPPGR